MGDVWSFVKSFVGGMFGLSGFESPRKLLFNDIGTTLLAPTVANLWTQQYLDLLSSLVVVILPVVMIEFVVRFVRGISNNNIGSESLAWLKTMVFMLGIVPVLPLLTVSAKALFDALGYYLMSGFMGTTDLKKLLAALEVLTGHASLDAILSMVQIVFLFVLFLSNYAMLVMFFASAFVLVLGVQFRWVGSFGGALFRFSIMFSVFAVSWDLIVMVIFGIDFGLQRIDAPHNPTAKGAFNTVAVLAAALVLPAMWKALKPAAVAVGTSASSAVSRLRNKSQGGGPVRNGSLGAEASRQQSQRSMAHRQRNSSGRVAKLAADVAGASPPAKAAIMVASKVNARRKARNDKRRAQSSSTAQRSAPRTAKGGSRSARRNPDQSSSPSKTQGQASKRQSNPRQPRNPGRSGSTPGQSGGTQGSPSQRQSPKSTPPNSGRSTNRKQPPRSPRGGRR